MKSPRKWASKELRELGFTRTRTDRTGEYYRGADGAQFHVPEGLSAGTAIRVVGNARQHLGLSSNVRRQVEEKPSLTRGRIRFSEHARDRWALMRQQAAVGAVELEACLFTPDHVEHSTKDADSWLFSTARLTAVVAFPEGREPVLTTVLWSRGELFDANPRPEARRDRDQ